jgi:hypothetical protein
MAVEEGVCIPTVLRTGPYRLFFYAGDAGEPEHVHVEREQNVAKFWLDPVRLERSGGFGRTELMRIQRIVEENHLALLEAWHDYFQT